MRRFLRNGYGRAEWIILRHVEADGGRAEGPLPGGRGWLIGAGTAFLLLGILAILFHVASTIVAGWMLGVLLLLLGAGELIVAGRLNNGVGENWLSLLFGMIGVVAGIMTLLNPAGAAQALTLLLGFWFIVDGGLRIGRATSHKPVLEGLGGLSLASGILGVLLGLILIATFPQSFAILGILLGIWLLLLGGTLLAVGLKLPKKSGGDRHPGVGSVDRNDAQTTPS